MFAIIAAKDVREVIRDGRLLWAGGLVVLLMLVALAAGWNRQAQVNSERAAGQALDYEAWLQQGHRHPHDAAEQGMHVFKPEPPLAVLDPGIEPFVGSTVWLQAHRQSELKFRPAQDATGLQRFGELSPAWILQVLLPLIVIVIGFNAVSGERERGTLRQLLSIGVPTRSLLFGKAAALAGCVAALIAPVCLVFLAIVVARLPAGERLDVRVQDGLACSRIQPLSRLLPVPDAGGVRVRTLIADGSGIAPRLLGRHNPDSAACGFRDSQFAVSHAVTAGVR